MLRQPVPLIFREGCYRLHIRNRNAGINLRHQIIHLNQFFHVMIPLKNRFRIRIIEPRAQRFPFCALLNLLQSALCRDFVQTQRFGYRLLYRITDRIQSGIPQRLLRTGLPQIRVYFSSEKPVLLGIIPNPVNSADKLAVRLLQAVNHNIIRNHGAGENIRIRDNGIVSDLNGALNIADFQIAIVSDDRLGA